MYSVETVACVLASELAQEGGEVLLDNQGVVKTSPMRRTGVVKD